ncbi:HNH endonuclease signature motif containing protein [Prevotellamassilia timonensis]|uniref:HNH endonuclease n=2 Tax=Prevotellamassilia timonensis TaxID=1852370 RepID=UPI00307A5A22
MSKDKQYIKQIHTRRWLMLRREVLSRHPLCERCQAEGRTRAATEVHHITPVEEGVSPLDKRTLMFDAHNLQALCHECHVRTHTELGRSGRQANADRQHRKAEATISRFFSS